MSIPLRMTFFSSLAFFSSGKEIPIQDLSFLDCLPVKARQGSELLFEYKLHY